jgi:serine/threonine protein kinase
MHDARTALDRAKRIDAACDQFEADFKAGRSPNLDAFVARAADAERDTLRLALEAIELELRERRMADTSVAQDSVVSAVDQTTEGTALYEATSEAIPRTIARFEILGIVGVGSFGRVYKGRDPQLGREVAIKVPLPSTIASAADKDRFLREGRTAARINHPNVCQIFEVGEYEGRPYIVMGIVPGKSLAEVFEDLKAPLPSRQIAQVAYKIAVALAAAHGRGIVHRDLKPGNVMFDRERKDIVVMDFGLARGPQLGDARATQSGVVMGTPAYMSPEQARGESKDVGPSGDIYALGVMLYELLTGTRPFVGTATEVIGQILHVDPVPPSQRKVDVDPALEAICLKAMAKAPAQRYGSMNEMAKALSAVARPAAPAALAAFDTACAADTRNDAAKSTSGTPDMSDVFAAISADRQAQHAAATATVESAVKRSGTPPWVWPTVVATMLGGFLLLAGITFFTQSRGVRVTIELTDIDLSDLTLSYLN